MSKIKEYTYIYKGKKVKLAEHTARQLNYALTLNYAKDRYVKVDK